jgi:hypothetical protein
MLNRWCGLALISATVVAVAACQTPASIEQQTAALTLSTKSLAVRQVQSRRFETQNERLLLSACAGVLQDLGFTIDESAPKMGLIVASKDRDAIEADQVAGQILLAALIAALGGQPDPVWERNQKIRISVVAKPLPSGSELVRVTFQRVIWNTKDQISRVESIDDPIIYQQFFDKLAQAVFLEAHQI